VRDRQRPAGGREQLKLSVSSTFLFKRQHRVRPLLGTLSPARKGRGDRSNPCAFEPALLALQPDENLLLPAFPDPLDPQGREMDSHPVFEAGAEESVHVRMSGAALATVLMDGEHALGASGGAAEGLLDGVTQNALAEMTVQSLEPLGRGVVHGQDEAEVDGIPEPASVLAEGFSDGRFVAPHEAVALTNAVELTPLPVGQPLLAVCDVAHLGGGSIRVSVIASFDEEHVRPSRRVALRSGNGKGPAPRR
jgi:hypothetical protein